MEFKISFPKRSNSNTIFLHYCKVQHCFLWSWCSPAEEHTGLTHNCHTNIYMILPGLSSEQHACPRAMRLKYLLESIYKQVMLGGHVRGASQNTNLQRKVSILRKPATANPFLQKRLPVVTISLSFFLQYYSLSLGRVWVCAHTLVHTHVESKGLCWDPHLMLRHMASP